MASNNFTCNSGLSYRARKAKIAVFFVLLLVGCGGGSPLISTTVKASGPMPFPTVPISGGTVTIEPGVYTCPSSLPSGSHIIGHGAVIPQEMLVDAFAPIANRSASQEVRVMCPAGLDLKDVNDIELSGMIIDFQGNNAGLVLDSITYSKFEIGLANSSGTAATLTSNDGNSMGNNFPRLIIYNAGIGLLMTATNSKATTWNDFGHVDMVNIQNIGIDVSQFADTNTFAAVRIRMHSGAQAGVVFNDNGVLGDVDASGNTFAALSCDADNSAAFAGYCADFRGDTVGNNVTVGFGILPDANKIHFANAFSQSSNIVTKMQEHPKQ